MGDGAVPPSAVVNFRGINISISRHPIRDSSAARGAASVQLSSSPEAFGDYALPGLDTMDIEEEVGA